MARSGTEQDPGVPQTDTDSVSVKEGSRALVTEVTVPGSPVERVRRTVRPNAAFVTQLIATAAGSPQTRGRGRAAPEEAASAYDASASTATGKPRPKKDSLSRLS